jgi:acyl-coenzyme A synthetase/AMP-(fatty) acid ligase
MKIPSPYDYLAFAAKTSPSNAAYISQDQQTSYRELHALVKNAAANLRERGIRPGENVAIHHNDIFVAYILILALFHEGANCCLSWEHFDSLPIDHYLTHEMKPFMTEENTIIVNRNWIVQSSGVSRVNVPRLHLDVEAPVIAFSSSGTTGNPKLIAISLREMELRLYATLKSRITTGPIMTMIGLRTLAGFQTAMRALASAEAISMPATISAAVQILVRRRITEFMGSPSHLASITRYLSGKTILLPHLRVVYTTGAPIPSSLLNRVRTEMCQNVMGLYGSSEAGTTCLAPVHALARHLGAGGYPVPGVELDIVDENDQPVALGEEGIIRFRNDYCLQEYLGNPEESAVAFRDGWFYPGDIGLLRGDGLLVVTGRSVDVINASGLKVNPLVVEGFLLAQAGVQDAAVFAAKGVGGIDEIWAAIIPSGDLDDVALMAKAQGRLGQRAPRRIFQVSEIPRNENDKTLRDELRDQVEQMLLEI